MSEKYLVKYDDEEHILRVKDLDSEITMISKVTNHDKSNFFNEFAYAVDALREKSKKHSLNGKVVCVDQGTNHFFTTGKVYPIVDGRLMNDDGFSMNVKRWRSMQDFFRTVNDPDYNAWDVKFIEYKGEVTVMEDET